MGGKEDKYARWRQAPAIEADTKGAWTTDPMLDDLLRSRVFNKRTRVEWDKYPAKKLPEESRLRRDGPGFLLVGGIDPEFPHQISTGERFQLDARGTFDGVFRIQ